LSEPHYSTFYLKSIGLDLSKLGSG
jgi:hypothetical protein